MELPINLPQRANIQGFWKLDETSGTRADKSDNGNTLQDNNTVLYGTGKIGNAADFELSNSEYLSITDALQTGLDITGEITICAWVKRETVGVRHAIVSKWSWSAGANRSYILEIHTDNKVYCYLSSDGNNQTIANSADTINTDWRHIAVTLNQTTDLIQIYIDGLTNGNAVAYVNNIADKSDAFAIGARDIIGTPTTFFDGLIDETIIWNKCLTVAEVLQVKNISKYNYGRGNFFIVM